MKRHYFLSALAGLGLMASGAALGPHLASAADIAGPPPMAGGPASHDDGFQGRPWRMHREMWKGHHHNRGEHLDGKIAFLKAELKIKSNQESAWAKFEKAIRSNAKTMQSHRDQMKKDGKPFFDLTVPEKLDRMESRMSTHLAALQSIKGETKGLYGVLSADQKKTFDELFPGPMMRPF